MWWFKMLGLHDLGVWLRLRGPGYGSDSDISCCVIFLSHLDLCWHRDSRVPGGADILWFYDIENQVLAEKNKVILETSSCW